MSETDAKIAVVTETWIADGDSQDSLIQGFSLGSGIGMITRNRHKNSRGVAHGGVAVLWRESMGEVRRVKPATKNDNDYEVLVAATSIKGHSRRIVIIACYLPPNYTRKKGQAALEYVGDVVVEVKKFIMGDFNQWAVGDTLLDFTDIKEVEVGNTRGNRSIDKIFCNLGRSVVESGTLAPLEMDDEPEETRRSDHRVAFCKLDIPRLSKFVWETYTYRHFTPEAEELFKSWIVLHQWDEVLGESTSNGQHSRCIFVQRHHR